MTVADLLESILRIYPGATPEAVASFRPVFLARLQHREGPKLADAANEVFGAFQPKASKPFPIPADFEQHLPSIHHLKRDAESAPIRQWMQDRAERSQSLFRDWHAIQGRKIKEARPLAVYGQCVLLAKLIADHATPDTKRIVLTPSQIDRCDQRALSAARVGKFGALPSSEDAWITQTAQIRAEWEALAK